MRLKDQTQLADYFDNLKNRSGLTWPEIAKACGYKGQSSIQRYYTPGGMASDRNYLPQDIIKGLLDIMVGRGAPPITKEDVLLMAPTLYSPVIRHLGEDFKSGGFSEHPYNGEYYKSKSPIGGKIPVLGFASGSSETNAINWDMDVPIDWVDPLPSMSGVAKSAALMILSDSMAPRYRENEIIFVNRSRTPDMGKDCVIDTRDGHTHIKRFLRQDKEHIYLEQFNPPKELKFHKRDVIGIYAVIGRL